MKENYLFSQRELSEYTNNITRKVREEISNFTKEEMDDNKFTLKISRLITNSQLTTPILDEANIETSDEEVEIEPDPYNSGFLKKGRTVKATKITYHVPFKGNGELFEYRPSTSNMNPPTAIVDGEELQISSAHAGVNIVRDSKQHLAQALSQIKWYLNNVDNDVIFFNNMIEREVNSAIVLHKTNLEKKDAMRNDLGFKSRNKS